MRRLLASLTAFVALSLVLAPVALAHNDGRGFYGETNDVVTTNTGFILIIFFPLFIFTMSMIQRHLEKRKDARIAAASSRRTDERWRGGW
jgi:hypothetical protein